MRVGPKLPVIGQIEVEDLALGGGAGALVKRGGKLGVKKLTREGATRQVKAARTDRKSVV